MLAIISDLHLTDGTSGATIHPGAFHILAERLCDLAERASWRSDGTYRPIDRMDLVLLGDVLDVIRSTRWLQGSVRPWDNMHSPEAVEVVSTITGDILQANEPALHVLRSLAHEGAVRIPHGSRDGLPVASSDEHPVPVHIHYMVGNHDWMFHLRGNSYDLLREQVARHMGLANRSDNPFPHDPLESDELLEIFRQHRVFARHGDIFDPLNFSGDRDMSSLGDAVVIQLVNRFAEEVTAEMADDLPAGVLAGLREIDNVRPLLLVPVWIDGLLERGCPYPSVHKKVKQVWDRLTDELLELPIVREGDSWSPFDLVDGLAGALKFSKRLSIGWSSKITGWLDSLRGASSKSFYHHALAEQDFRNRRARHIVYGHTHHAECVPLDASYADGYVLEQMYFNSGTWRRVHQQTRLAPGEHEFIPSETISLLSFFQDGERGGRPFEVWSGMLGCSPALLTRNQTGGQTSHATEQPLSTSGAPVRAPHYLSRTAVGSQPGFPQR